jgi:hypothetical protein
MTVSNPPDAPPLTLPPAATLNAPPNAPHPDSQEALQHGRHRVAQELETIHLDPRRTSEDRSLRSPTLRAHVAQRSHEGIQRRPSRASTAPDIGEAEDTDTRRPAVRGQVRWCGPIAKFWQTQIDIVIEDGDHRDYLGKSPFQGTCLSYINKTSSRAHFPRLPPYLPRTSHDRRHYSPAIPPTALNES